MKSLSLATIILALAACNAQAQPPNIVLVIADDLNVRDIPLAMPKVSELAEQAAVFEGAFAAYPLCGPSRISLLTGKLPRTHGFYTNDPTGFDASDTIATRLHGAGYATTVVGKLLNKHWKATNLAAGWDTYLPFQRHDDFGTEQSDMLAHQALAAMSACASVAPALAAKDTQGGTLRDSKATPDRSGGHRASESAHLARGLWGQDGTRPASAVDPVGNGLEVRRVDAESVPAEVIEVAVGGYRAAHLLVHPAMGLDYAPAVPGGSIWDLALRVPSLPRALPHPASGGSVDEVIDAALSRPVPLNESPRLPGDEPAPVRRGKLRSAAASTLAQPVAHPNSIGTSSTTLNCAPFFLYVGAVAPHGPLGGPDRCQSRPLPEKPETVTEKRWAQRMSALCGLDDMVASIVEARGPDTYVIFTGDNGWIYAENHRNGKQELVLDAAQVPLIVWGPGVVPARRREMVSLIDVSATVLRLGNVSRAGVEGRSILPLLQDSDERWGGTLILEGR